MASRALQTLCARGELERAVDLLSRVDAPPPAIAYISLLKACKKRRSKALSHAKQVHAHITHFHVPLSGLLGDYLVVTLSMCGAVDDAVHVLRALPQRSVFSWTSIISAYTECGHAHDAVTSYQCMLHDGVEPSPHTFLALFSACSSIPYLDQGRNIHAYACMKGFDSEASVGNAIFHMYLECAALVDAENVFVSLPERTLFSWNSMLSTCVDHSRAKNALQWYTHMESDGVEPNHYTFIILLKACGRLADLKQGEILHTDARKRGYASDGMVGSTLITMYGKSGAIVGAEDVFGELTHRDVVSWNALLSAYAEQGFGEKALCLYRQMQEDGVELTQRTYVIVLRACANLAEKEEVRSLDGLAMTTVSYHIGRAIHADACKRGFLSSGFLQNTLVSMYGKCGAILEAEHLFEALPLRNIVSWNAMLSAYVDHGDGRKALCLLIQMEKERMSPDQPTFVSALQAVALIEGEGAPLSDGRFSKRMSLEIGHALHGAACRYSLASDAIIGTALLSMYGRCGAIIEAEYIFHALTERTVVSWNAMLSAYVEQGEGGKALQLYAQMQAEGFNADQITFIQALQACGTLADKEEFFLDEGISTKVVSFLIGQALHAAAYRGCFAFDISIGNTLVNLYGKCGAIAEAENVFGGLSHGTIVSWNAILSAYAEHDQGEKALMLYTEMCKRSLRPDILTFVCVLQACGDLTEKESLFENEAIKIVPLEIGRALHADCKTEGFCSHAFIRNTLVRMYGKCEAIEEAEEVWGIFAHADGRTLVTWPNEYGIAGNAKNELITFSSLDVVSWNVMLSAYAEHGLGYKTVWLYRQMLEHGVSINLVSVTRTLQACSTTGSLETCKQLHFLMVSAGFDRISSMAATLIHAYGSCASMVDADSSLRELLMPDIIAWNACIAGYAGVGDSLASLYMFDELKFADAQPTEATFSSVLSACTQTGLISGFYYFESMRRDFCITPESKHYCSLLDLLGRIGDFRKIEHMLEGETLRSSLIAWLSLLGACYTHRNSMLAERAYDNAIKLQPDQATAYILMSNIYAEIEMKEYFEKEEDCREKECVKVD